ncbi:hypothetical protein O1W68_03640 [Rhodococcus sp. H36-A4]|uniref:hypothetical protein n=1 Tax=Rhodococcus sp. H36-A4 TaxID=3004353 RepID=UPI0022AF914F|nr:hypothetical protein [Rhodococcus sp. H36-A4]MCZ4077026.1 hypothetical protein [Rhodococcus sp. H36-A4]
MQDLGMTKLLDEATMDRLTTAVVALDPKPRERRWVSLSFAITDAVWSIGAGYASTVVPLVYRVALQFDVTEPSVAASTPSSEDPVPLRMFADRFDVASLLESANKQRTSTGAGGILKAKAVLEHVEIFRAEGIETLDDARQLLEDKSRFERVDSALRSVAGEGSHGVRRGYLWMLIGDDHRIKPDRMVLRWFRRQGVDIAVCDAAALVHELVARINRIPGRAAPTTAWELDHAMWNAGRQRL